LKDICLLKSTMAIDSLWCWRPARSGVSPGNGASAHCGGK